MKFSTLDNPVDVEAIGRRIYDLIEELFPICRSITGNGVRQTLNTLRRHIPLKIHEIPSGTNVFDWTVPKEWNIRDAYVKDSKGEKRIDFKQSNLHVLNYSLPVKTKLTLTELKPHLHTLPDLPASIPYKTSYYKEDWGFCLSHDHMRLLEDGEYEVFIDASLENGHLTYGELYIPGRTTDEILISTHVCHPSLANDNLSGVCLAALLARQIMALENRYSYRFLFIPGTIGAITWLHRNFASVGRIKNGLVLTGVGDSGKMTYKKSRRGDAEIDQVAEYVLTNGSQGGRIIEFSPYGYDERQYCSPGFNLPVGRLSRTPFGEYPEYHTSADNLDFVSPLALGESFSVLLKMLWILEGNVYYTNESPYCEPQLGRRGLYDYIGSNQMDMLWVLNFSDSSHSLLDIAARSGIEFEKIQAAADILNKFDLLKLGMIGSK